MSNEDLPSQLRAYRAELVMAVDRRCERRRAIRRRATVGALGLAAVAGLLIVRFQDDRSATVLRAVNPTSPTMVEIPTSEPLSSLPSVVAVTGSSGTAVQVRAEARVDQATARTMTMYQFDFADGVAWGVSFYDDCVAMWTAIRQDERAWILVHAADLDKFLEKNSQIQPSERWAHAELPFVILAVDPSVLSTLAASNPCRAPGS